MEISDTYLENENTMFSMQFRRSYLSTAVNYVHTRINLQPGKFLKFRYRRNRQSIWILEFIRVCRRKARLITAYKKKNENRTNNVPRSGTEWPQQWSTTHCCFLRKITSARRVVITAEIRDASSSKYNVSNDRTDEGNIWKSLLQNRPSKILLAFTIMSFPYIYFSSNIPKSV